MSALIKDYYGLSKVLLEDCPFCGSDELTIVKCNNDCESSKYDYPYLFYVLCRECLSRGAKKVMEEDAIDVWNERHCSLPESVETMRSSEWISVKDRLPEKNQTVLTAIFGADFVVLNPGETKQDAFKRANAAGRVSIGCICDDGWYGADGFPEVCTPSYWKPLPELPENPFLLEAN